MIGIMKKYSSHFWRMHRPPGGEKMTGHNKPQRPRGYYAM